MIHDLESAYRNLLSSLRDGICRLLERHRLCRDRLRNFQTFIRVIAASAVLDEVALGATCTTAVVLPLVSPANDIKKG